MQAVSRLTLPTAEQLVYLGSYKPALTAYSIGLSAAESLGNPELSMEAVLGIAAVLLNTGYYQEALNRLINFETDDMPVHLVSRTKLLRGEIFMRLNRYSESLNELEHAHQMFSDQSNLEGQLAAEKTENTILRDLGRYDEAVSLGLSLVQRAEEGLTQSPLLASCFQALARSLAFRSDTSEGIAAAQRSLEISLSIHSIRTEGNSYLALGEVFRHGNLFDEAIVNYVKAIKIAETIANRDSFLWSSLGLADALLLKGDVAKAKEVLEHVGEIVRNADSHYPLEHLHWQLSTATVNYINGELSDTDLKAAAAQYQSLKITWPEEYVRSVLINGKPSVAKDM
jgi:tetratricopeptide (TPR) repeat protein